MSLQPFLFPNILVLLLDVGPDRHLPVWVPTKALFSTLQVDSRYVDGNLNTSTDANIDTNIKDFTNSTQTIPKNDSSVKEEKQSRGYFIISKKCPTQAPSRCLTTGLMKAHTTNINTSTNNNQKSLDATE